MTPDTKLRDVIKALIDLAESDEEKYFETVQAIALIFPQNLKEQLAQLVKGPVWDGDVMSKSQRAELFDMGLAMRICAKGEQGYTGATYTAYSILQRLTN